MTNILIYAFDVFVITGLYLWFFKKADIEISFITGILFGVSFTSFDDEDNKTKYLDFNLGIVNITFVLYVK
jgi:hypothetical protein